MVRTFNTYVLSLVFLFAAVNSSAQNQADNWYFGNKAALNFSTCNPLVLNNSQINTIEGCATISDANGNLLFYTDGIKVWNKLHATMQNGTGLYGHPSSTQSGVIVPQPGNDSIYYIFTVDVEDGVKGLNYSIVNMNLNGGLGSVITKNTNLLASANEKITAVRHGNQNDIWVITRQFESDKYLAWLVTAAGVSNTPVISISPNYLGAPINTSRGYLKPSTDGKKLVAAFGETAFLEISKFNDLTGTISNILKMDSKPATIKTASTTIDPYGVEFSPNSQLLYTTTRLGASGFCGGCPGSIYYINQYNISNFDSLSIANSVTLIDSGGSAINPGYNLYATLQLAKNGKIYVAQYFNKKLSVINNPNNSGLACNFQVDAVDLGIGQSTGGLPTFIQTYFSPNFQTYDFNYIEDCNKTVNFTLNTTYNYDSVRWNFDDIPSGVNNLSVLINPVHSFTSSGLHNINLYVFRKYGCLNIIDTVKKSITVGSTWFNFGPDTSYCAGDTITLNATVTGTATYLWSTGATTPTLKVFKPNNYWCEVTRGGCTYRDDIFISEKLMPIINFGSNTVLCEDNTLLLDATNATSTYLWQDNSTNSTYLVNKAGKYFVTVNKQGCVAKDTIDVVYNLKPKFSLGTDNRICMGSTITLNPLLSNVNYLWQDGSTGSTYSVSQPGLYSLTATNNCGSTTASITIGNGICELYVPNSFTPNGDSKNDLFKASYGDNVTEFHLQVFNRYGQMVFDSKDKNNGWDGTFLRKQQPSGTYAWMIQYKTVTNISWQKLQGTVLLIH